MTQPLGIDWTRGFRNALRNHRFQGAAIAVPVNALAGFAVSNEALVAVLALNVAFIGLWVFTLELRHRATFTGPVQAPSGGTANTSKPES